MASQLTEPVARLSFYWETFCIKCGPFGKTVDFLQNYGFLNKIVDLFNKIVDLLFREGVLQHLENPLAMSLHQQNYFTRTIMTGIHCQPPH